jgi:hypothetical protein
MYVSWNPAWETGMIRKESLYYIMFYDVNRGSARDDDIFRGALHNLNVACKINCGGIESTEIFSRIGKECVAYHDIDACSRKQECEK